MGNAVSQGLLLLEQRKRQARQDQQAEEQREIENIQAQKDQSLREKQEKRLQAITDLKLKTDTQAENLRNLQGKLAAQTGQAFGFTPTEDVFRLPEVAEDFIGPRFGGTPETFDITGQVEHFGGNPFQSEQEAQQLQEGALAQIQFNLLQKEAEARVSSPVLAGQQRGLFQADLAENARLNKIKSAEKLQEGRIELEGLKGTNRIEAVERRGQLQLQRDAVKNRFGDERTMGGLAAGALYANSDLTGNSKFKFAVLKKVQEKGTEIALEMGFSPEQVSKVSFQAPGTKIKQDILELTPVLTTIDEIKLLLDEGIAKGWFPENLPLAAIRKSIEGVKGVFGQSEMAIRLEEMVGRAATIARSVGERRFTDQDIIRAVQLMLSPGLRATDGERRYKALKDNARFIFESRTRGIDPIQLAIMFGPDFQSKMGIDVSNIKETQTARTLEADPNARGPDERAVKDAEGNLLWFNTKTGNRRKRSQ